MKYRKKKHEMRKYSGTGSLSPLFGRGLGGGYWGEAV
jgi:hypothetical protein